MLDPKLLRNEPQQLADVLARRGYQLDVAAVEKLEQEIRSSYELNPAMMIG